MKIGILAMTSVFYLVFSRDDPPPRDTSGQVETSSEADDDWEDIVGWTSFLFFYLIPLSHDCSMLLFLLS